MILSTKMNHYLSLDIETTGTDPLKDQIIEVGMVIDDLQGNIHDKPSLTFHVSHERYEGNAYALAMNHEILRELANKATEAQVIPVARVAKTIRDFVRYYHPKGKITAAGKNFGGFDLQFLRQLPNWQACIRHRYIDPAMLWWNPEQDGFDLPNTDEMNERAGIKPCIHRALYDAIDTCTAVRGAIAKGQVHG